MTRLNLVLLLGVVLSALYLVNVQYDSRRLYSALDRARSEARKLAIENERLQVEKRAQATSARVEALAKSSLAMRAANPAIMRPDINSDIMTMPLRDARELFEKQYLAAQISRFGGNISKTSSFVGMERSALHRKLKLLGIHSEEKIQ